MPCHARWERTTPTPLQPDSNYHRHPRPNQYSPIFPPHHISSRPITSKPDTLLSSAALLRGFALRCVAFGGTGQRAHATLTGPSVLSGRDDWG